MLGGALRFGLRYGYCIGLGVLLCFGIMLMVFGRCFVFCGIEGLKS